MKQLTKTIRILFGFALGLSVCFPLGILGIIFGAIGELWLLLAAGILFTVLGFYLMPLLWVRFAEKRGDRRLWQIIEEDRIYTVQSLCMQTGYAPDDVRNRIKRMIAARELIGYIFEEDSLIPLDPEKRKGSSPRTQKCPCCGALMHSDGLQFICDYCRHSEADEG